MSNGVYRFTLPENEPVKSYAPGTKERTELLAKLKELKSRKIDMPLIIGGEDVKSDQTMDVLCPHNTSHVLATAHLGGTREVNLAIEAALDAKASWAAMRWEDRAAIFMRAAELLAGPHRATVNAATMLGQSKTIHQAEIDAACELIDFFRFNVYFMQMIYGQQPPISPTGIWNRSEYRPLEGFVFAVTPFNFVSIGGNLPTSPAMMGNVGLWKPATSSIYSNYFIMQILMEAGLPKGVINFTPGRGSSIGDPVFASKYFAGIHFTGSTDVFKGMWKTIGEQIPGYLYYPRVVGETGGKDFIFAHNSADLEALVTATVRGAFEFQGQKCSAASRVYIPESMWESYKKTLLTEMKKVKMGDVEDFTNFMGAVIDKGAFKTITGYIDHAKDASDAEIIHGGKYDNSKGYFIEPTIIHTTNPKFKSMEEEIFGPVLTIYVYPDDQYEETIKLCDDTSPYALTGAIFANDRDAIIKADRALVNAAGNFYINDKPTGAVVGQQPFGGARGSGTNDKAGSYLNLLRWVSARTIKENFNPPKDFKYPYMSN